MFVSAEPTKSAKGLLRAIALLYLFGLVWIGFASGRAALCSWVQDNAVSGKSMSRADQAIAFDPGNADAHKTRGMLLLSEGRYSEAARNFQSALELRPEDYLLWLRLGYACYKAGDLDAALGAYEKAVNLAPFYAQPRWYMGRLWLKRANRDEAFRQLSRSAAYDPTLLPLVLHLARTHFVDDPVAMQNAIEPSTPAAKLELARYFVKHGFETKEMRSFLTSEELSERDRSALVEQLIAAEKFDLAFEIWAGGSSETYKNNVRTGDRTYSNSGFEKEINPGERGFSWQFARSPQGMKIAIDRRMPYSGASSLQIDFSGNSASAGFLVSEIVLAEPDTDYQLKIAVRTQDLVTGGLPVATAIDANTGELLARTAPFPQSTTDWQRFSATLRTTSHTRAVVLGIQRLPCSTGLCPIFGKVWIDDFQLAIP